MSYDVYVERPQGDTATRVRLLVTNDAPLNDYLHWTHRQWDKNKQRLTRGEFNQLIANELKRLQSLGIKEAAIPNMDALPLGSWFLHFTFTLAKPWMSKDDEPFYVAESVNPVRKDKVFKVPVMSAAAWKGLLRWTAMRLRLYDLKDKPDEFAQERFCQTMLFGDEKGEEAGQTKDFAVHLDKLGGPAARKLYEQKTREYFSLEEKIALPHHAGRLMFYPTFFDLIDVEVINPHSRKTKAGTHPIYLECVPAGARGAFSLLYVPFDLIGQDAGETRAQAAQDLATLCEAIGALMLTYGFSAKRTSGYGTAMDKIEKGLVRTRADSKLLTRLSQLAAEVKHAGF